MPLLDKLRKLYGGGPVCSELHIAPSTYYHCQQQRHHPDKRSARAQRDDWLKKEILRVYDGNHQVPAFLLATVDLPLPRHSLAMLGRWTAASG